MTFELTSPAFATGAEIPRKYTCDGEDVSPPLEWAGTTENAVTLALIVDDPDARGWVHGSCSTWTRQKAASCRRGLVVTRRAGAGHERLRPHRLGRPVPAVGHPPLSVHAGRAGYPARATGAPKADEVRAAMEGHVLGEARLDVSYTRGPD